MLKYFYRWRHQRRKKRNSVKIPGKQPLQINPGSYLNETALHKQSFEVFDLPRKRRRQIRALIILGLILVLAWLIYESMTAFVIFD